MEQIKFKNRFRILYKGKVLALNSITNIKGYNQFTSAFTTLQDAINARRFYCTLRNIEEEDLLIESYSEGQKHLVPTYSQDANKYFERSKTFSGRGLRFKNYESSKDSKYSSERYYGAEVESARSAFKSKGTTTLPKEKRRKNQGLVDSETFEKISRMRGGTFSLEYSLIDALRKKQLGKKALRRYLRSSGYTVAQAISISEKVFDKEIIL